MAAPPVHPPPIIIDVSYALITPAFIGGANAQSTAELRIPSIKGCLRFWWRATAGFSEVKELHRREAELFGSTTTGQSRLRIAWYTKPSSESFGASMHVRSLAGAGASNDELYGAVYLGYGVIEARDGRLKRPCIKPCTLRLRMHLHASRKDVHDGAELATLVRALIALGTLGGIGSKSRKGYGSMAITALSVADAAVLEPHLLALHGFYKSDEGVFSWTPPQTVAELADVISSLGQHAASSSINNALPEWTALSAHSRYLLAPMAAKDAMLALDAVGCELVRFRSWGKGGRILGKEQAKPRFHLDHDLYKGRGTGTHPERIVFGLPHNYTNKQLSVSPAKRKSHGNPSPANVGDRRASPFLIHMHMCKEGPVAVLSFLPACFLPAGSEVRLVWGNNVNRIPEFVPLARHNTADAKLWKPIHDFLSRVAEQGKAKENGFLPGQEVIP